MVIIIKNPILFVISFLSLPLFLLACSTRKVNISEEIVQPEKIEDDPTYVGLVNQVRFI